MRVCPIRHLRIDQPRRLSGSLHRRPYLRVWRPCPEWGHHQPGGSASVFKRCRVHQLASLPDHLHGCLAPRRHAIAAHQNGSGLSLSPSRGRPEGWPPGLNAASSEVFCDLGEKCVHSVHRWHVAHHGRRPAGRCAGPGQRKPAGRSATSRPVQQGHEPGHHLGPTPAGLLAARKRPLPGNLQLVLAPAGRAERSWDSRRRPTGGPLRLGGVGSSTPGRNNQALPPAVPSAGHAAGRLALTVPCSLRCAAHGYFNAGSVAGQVVALLPAVRASAQNRLRRQHPQGPVDRLAGDRLPLPRSRPISPTEGPAARRSLAACTCPGVSRCLRPPFRPRSKSQPSGSARRQSERRNPRRHRAEWRAG